MSPSRSSDVRQVFGLRAKKACMTELLSTAVFLLTPCHGTEQLYAERSVTKLY